MRLWPVYGATFFLWLSGTACTNPTVPLFARTKLFAAECEIGLIASLGSLSSLLVRVPSGLLSDRWGRKRLMLMGALVSVSAPFAFMFSNSLGILGIACLYEGFASLYMPAAVAAIFESTDAKSRPYTLAHYTMAGSSGVMAGPALAGFLIRNYGYEPVYWMAAGSAAVGTLFVLAVPTRPSAGRSETAVFVRFRKLMGEPGFAATTAARAFQMLPTGALVAFLPIYARETCGLREDVIGLLASARTVASLFARPAAAFTASRFARGPTMMFGMITVATAVAAVPLFTDFATLAVLCVLVGIGEALNQIATVATIGDMSGQKRFGLAAGIVGASFDVGMMSGKFAAGPLIPSVGYVGAFGCVATATVLYSFVLVAALRRRPP